MTAEKSTLVARLEVALIELTENLYKYVYDEEDLEKLNKAIPIEHIDQTKEEIETNLITLIVESVASGLASPVDKRAYDIIDSLWDVLNLDDVLFIDTINRYNKVLERVGIKKRNLTVQDLINELNTVEDKTKPVFIYNNKNSDIYSIELVDTDISDRVDINIVDKPE